ncbi:P-loop containing nucleoside triphosphate hydrolase protein [Scheffersomyces xylosifermentans]|uniref:P-loop containing nucleoside triphosphate hydrolase protein n=1 Tax=Scheffersomyces xylosifermentans TaxID=1304137 RepID=UPI00315CF74A
MSQQVSEFKWSNVSLHVNSRTSDNKKACLIDNASGSVRAGELMALMGPSGSGKTTLLNILAHRSNPRSATQSGTIYVNNEPTNLSAMKELSSYVEQEDSLIGSLTVQETVDFSARFAQLHGQYRKSAVERTIELLGLSNQKNVKIGNPIQKGISGGQKRRVSIASQIITNPSILFLDEPTSGLDSVASREVVSMIKRVAKEENMAVICSIHQPSTYTFELFDKVLFLSKGKTVYNDRVDKLVKYFESIGFQLPGYVNPSEYVLDLINTDFSSNVIDQPQGDSLLNILVEKWQHHVIPGEGNGSKNEFDFQGEPQASIAFQKEIRNTYVLFQRLLIKARRDIFTYYVRLVMYLGLAIMMGTVWLRLGSGQKYIQPFINAIFFSGAFMSFMSVAYIPSFIEDYQSYKKERLNGLYGPLAFSLSNFVIGLPFLFFIASIFSIITFFMCNFHKTASGFFNYLMWLFLDLIAAESMTIFISTIFPNFVISLALTAFANGLWMSVGGFLVPANILNKFWYYTFYWIDYQRYVFQGMMFNEFSNRNFNCDSQCHCMFDSPLASQCKIQGNAVLENLGYSTYDKSLWVGILLVLIFVFRLGSYAVLRMRK